MTDITLETQRQAKRARHKSKLYSLPICCEVQLSIICKVCGYFLTSLSSASHYVHIDIAQYRFGNHLLVLQDNQYLNLRIDHENEIFNNQQPFLMMYLKKVYCNYCNENCVGLYFQTTNMYGTSWLFEHFMIDMERTLLEDKKSRLMESTINQLYPLLNSLETGRKKRKYFQRQEVKKGSQQKDKVDSILRQKMVEKVIKEFNYKGFQQNRLKNQISNRILTSLSFYDRRTERLEKEFKLLMVKAQALKKMIIEKYSTLQSFKSLRNKRQEDKFSQKH